MNPGRYYPFDIETMVRKTGCRHRRSDDCVDRERKEFCFRTTAWNRLFMKHGKIEQPWHERLEIHRHRKNT
ncbi:hypothetical protein DCC85_18510 [Paenibacillus sp. CAA11]|uniref:hypothetical protein n=1 Tax=Paenibacillus sp. CAA11 TaxID=1532905 RepID=UPI000D394FE0|nr:hypothetical protein [Paenibacillus sp. CAA11]AWB45965.1 hypothetical protein DCC85_18510 [Paenibacillus sp. CAA11]